MHYQRLDRNQCGRQWPLNSWSYNILLYFNSQHMCCVFPQNENGKYLQCHYLRFQLTQPWQGFQQPYKRIIQNAIHLSFGLRLRFEFKWLLFSASCCMKYKKWEMLSSRQLHKAAPGFVTVLYKAPG